MGVVPKFGQPTPIIVTDSNGNYPGTILVEPTGGILFPVSLNDGNGNPIGSTAGALNVSATFSGSISGNAAAGLTGQAVPASADYLGVNIAGELVGVTGFSLTNSKAISVGIVDGNGNQITSFGGGTQYADGGAEATPTGTAALGFDGTDVWALRLDSTTHYLQVDVKNSSIEVTGSGTFATQSVDNVTEWNSVSLGSPTAYGTPPSGNVIGVNAYVTTLPAITIAGSQTLSTVTTVGTVNAVTAITDAVTVQQSTAANLLCTASIAASQTIAVTNTGTFAVQAAQNGTWTVDIAAAQTIGVTQSTSPWVVSNSGTFVVQATDDVTEWNGVALGSPTSMGTAPSGNVIGTNAANFVSVSGSLQLQSGRYVGEGSPPTLEYAACVDIASVGGVGVAENGILPVSRTPVADTFGWLTSVAQALSDTLVAVKTTPGKFGGYSVFNPNAGTVYFFWYNSSSATVGSVPLFQVGIPAGVAGHIEIGGGISFNSKLYVACSTSATSAAAPSTACVVTTLYV